jgi:NodT family efflux transporter outer membrane factor (OMF) lipoprotein
MCASHTPHIRVVRGIDPLFRNTIMPLQTRHLGAVSLLAICPFLASLGGCAVGPDFKKPDPPPVSSYTATPLANPAVTPGVIGGDAQTFVQAADIDGDWWTAFRSPALNALIEQSLKNNADLAAAEATLRQARETTIAQKGAFYPQIGAQFNASHQENPASLAPVPATNALQYDLFTPELTISYMPDIWGLTRRTVESYTAQADAVRYQMLAAYTTLVNNVIATAVQLAATQEEIAATKSVIEAEKKSVTILQYQKDKGYASGLDLSAQQTQLSAAQASLPPLIKQQAAFRDQLAVLTGKFPAEAPPENLKLSDLTLPANLPVSLPAKLVSQRPDVMQAEANLHAASAEIGIAIANRLPNITLSGNAGSTALVLNQIMQPGTEFWTIAAGLTQPLFQGGTLLHQERAARAAFDAAGAQYRSALLGAFQNVADTLVALEQDGDAVRSAAEADTAAKKALDITQRQLQDGYSNTLGLITAQQAYQQAEITLLQAQSARFADTAALFQALGGGWWHRTDLPDQDTNNGNAKNG